MTQSIAWKPRFFTFAWWSVYGAVFMPLLASEICRVALNPTMFSGAGDWIKAIFIMLFISTVINAPTANVAISCIRHPKDINRAAKWSALTAFGVSLTLFLIVAGLDLFLLTITYALVTGFTVWLTVHVIALKVKSLTEAQDRQAQAGPHTSP